MGVVTKFRKKPETNKEENKVDRHSFKRRIIAHKARVFTAVAVALIAICIIVAIIWISYYNKVYSDYEVTRSVPCEKVEGSNVLSYGSKFLTYSCDGMHCTNSKGKDTWSEPFEMQSPMVAVAGEYVACADFNGRKVYVFNTSGVLGEIQTGAPIKDIDISKDGIIVVVTEDDEVTPIDIYYYDGTKVANFRTTMSKSGYPIEVAISDNSKLLAVSYLYLDSGKLTTKLAMYNFGDVGQNETDNLVSGYDYEDEVIPSLKFIESDKLVAVGNDKLLFFKGKERPTNTETITIDEEIQAVFYGDGNVGLLFADKTGKARNRLDVYNSDGKKKSSIYFDIEYTDIFFANGMVVIYNGSSAEIYRTDGKLKYKNDFDEMVALMIPTSSATKYTIVTQDAIKNITLK